MWPILLIVTHTSKGDNFDQCYSCLYSVTHFPKFDPFEKMWPILLSVTHTLKCDNLQKCDPCLYDLLSQVWSIRPKVTHFAQNDS